MLTFHNVCLEPSFFQFTGISEQESVHIWLSIRFDSMYLVAVVGNVTILAMVRVQHSLHQLSEHVGYHLPGSFQASSLP